MTSSLPRLKPSPLPAIHPVPEYLADATLKAVYEETKAVLQVPWMGVVTMAFAHYPTFFKVLWSGLKDLAASREFVEACRDLRAAAEDSASDLKPEPIVEALTTMGYAGPEVDEIRALNEVFSHGNMPYLMIATAARLLLEGHELSSETALSLYQGRHGPSTGSRLLLMEAHHVDAATANVYENIQSTLGLPFVNTDYRAFARWPSYFALAWRGLADKVPTAAYESQVTRVHDFAVNRMLSLPHGGSLTPETLRAAASKDAPVEEVSQVVRLFQWLLPGLAVNVAFFRAQLIAGQSANRS